MVVWFRFADATPDAMFRGRWHLGDRLLYETEPLTPAQANGTAYWGIVDSDDRPLPTGDYRVELLEAETVVTTIPFRIEPRPATATPWQGRGWVADGGNNYANAVHDLHLSVPTAWTVGDELNWPVRILWVMGKLDDAGHDRLVVSIFRRRDRTWRSPEELYEEELNDLRSRTIDINGETKPFTDILHAGSSARSGVYEIEHVPTYDGSRVRLLLFARNGIGYAVNLKAVAGASEAEMAELAAVRQSMGL